MMKRLFLLMALLLVNPVWAADDYAKARYHYILYCQGCHTADGTGAEEAVPRLKDQIGYFLQVEGGREYLIQVPGAANSVLNDQDLTKVMNWIVQEFSGDSLPPKESLYVPQEVAELRRNPKLDLLAERDKLVERISRRLNKTIQ